MNQTFGGWTVTDFIRRIRELETELEAEVNDPTVLRERARAEKAEARVAELERELQFAIDLIGPEYPGMWIAHKAREREAE